MNPYLLKLLEIEGYKPVYEAKGFLLLTSSIPQPASPIPFNGQKRHWRRVCPVCGRNDLKGNRATATHIRSKHPDAPFLGKYPTSKIARQQIVECCGKNWRVGKSLSAHNRFRHPKIVHYDSQKDQMPQLSNREVSPIGTRIQVQEVR